MQKIFFLLSFFSLTVNLFSQLPYFGYKQMYFHRNDTIFLNYIYETNEKIDSIINKGYYIKLTKTKWISNTTSHKTFSIVKWKKIKSSKLFQEINTKYLNADFECREKGLEKVYYTDGSILKRWHYFRRIYSKEIKPKTDKKGNIKPVNSIYHRIQKGETLLDIAKKYYTTEKRILELNEFKDEIMPTKGRIRVQ